MQVYTETTENIILKAYSVVDFSIQMSDVIYLYQIGFWVNKGADLKFSCGVLLGVQLEIHSLFVSLLQLIQ